VTEAHAAGRELCESGLTFGGFLVLACPLKPDSAAVLAALRAAALDLKMITGDTPFTACQVSGRAQWLLAARSHAPRPVVWPLCVLLCCCVHARARTASHSCLCVLFYCIKTHLAICCRCC
jgi:magnesium-transporting ATPase (P-type)